MYFIREFIIDLVALALGVILLYQLETRLEYLINLALGG